MGWAKIHFDGRVMGMDEKDLFAVCTDYAQFVFHPTGALAALPVLLRVTAVTAGFGLFLRYGNLFWSVLLGEGILIGGWLVMQSW